MIRCSYKLQIAPMLTVTEMNSRIDVQFYEACGFCPWPSNLHQLGMLDSLRKGNMCDHHTSPSLWPISSAFTQPLHFPTLEKHGWSGLKVLSVLHMNPLDTSLCHVCICYYIHTLLIPLQPLLMASLWLFNRREDLWECFYCLWIRKYTQ